MIFDSVRFFPRAKEYARDFQYPQTNLLDVH